MSNGFLDNADIEKLKRYNMSQSLLSQSLLICAQKEFKTKEHYDFIKLAKIGTDFDGSCYWHKHPMYGQRFR